MPENNVYRAFTQDGSVLESPVFETVYRATLKDLKYDCRYDSEPRFAFFRAGDGTLIYGLMVDRFHVRLWNHRRGGTYAYGRVPAVEA